MYLRGDKVKHTKKPEWGSGIVLDDENDGKVVINFRDTGIKTISTAMDFLHKVSGGNSKDSKSALQKVKSSNGEKQCCIYAIKTLSDLKASFKNGGKGTFTEGKPWSTGRELFKDAKNEDKNLYVVFANADTTWDLLYYAKLTIIEILPNTDKKGKSKDMTRYSFEGMKRYPKRNPPYNKMDLLVDSTGEGIPEGYIKSYAICRKPSYLI